MKRLNQTNNFLRIKIKGRIIRFHRRSFKQNQFFTNPGKKIRTSRFDKILWFYESCQLMTLPFKFSLTFVQGSSRVHNSCFSIAFVQSPKFLFLTDVINSANRIASLVSKNDGNSSQYLLKASCAISPLWWSLHNPARKKCAKVYD